jgi:hypothetical protein
MISLAAEIQSLSKRVPVKVGDGGFTLLLKPVSEDDRLADNGIATRFWEAEGPEEVRQWMVARRRLRIEAVIGGWEGVTAPNVAGDEVPVPYSSDALARLLRVPGVAQVVIPIVEDHFTGKADLEAEVVKKVGESQPDFSGGDTSNTSQN